MACWRCWSASCSCSSCSRTIVSKGYTAFQQAKLTLDVFYDPQVIDPDGKRDPAVLASANYATLLRTSLRELFPDVQERKDVRNLYALLSNSAAQPAAGPRRRQSGADRPARDA